MKITSRPEDMVSGEGPYVIRMTYEQLQYIGALLMITRLGDGLYKEAAFDLMNTIEEIFDDDFLQIASDNVDLSITIEDDKGNACEAYHSSVICIEV